MDVELQQSSFIVVVAIATSRGRIYIGAYFKLFLIYISFQKKVTVINKSWGIHTRTFFYFYIRWSGIMGAFTNCQASSPR